MDELIDQSKFGISFPLWIVVYRELFAKRGLPDALVTGTSKDGAFFPFSQMLISRSATQLRFPIRPRH